MTTKLRRAVESYRRTGFVVAYEYLRTVAREHGLTVQQALDSYQG